MMIFYQDLLSRSLFTRLITHWPLALSKAGAQCAPYILIDPSLALSKAGRISIAVIIHSFDRRGSLSQSLFIPLILQDYRTHYSFA